MIKIQFFSESVEEEISSPEWEELEESRTEIDSDGKPNGPCWQFSFTTVNQRDERFISQAREFLPRIETEKSFFPTHEAVNIFQHGLTKLEQKFVEEKLMHEFQVRFDDRRIISLRRGHNFLYTEDSDLTINPWENFLAAYTAYKGLHEFLTIHEKFEMLHARTAHLYTCWQAFNIVKEIYLRFQASGKHHKLIEPVREEFKSNYRALRELLDDHRFSYGAELIGSWLDAGSNLPMTERLRLSMILTEESTSQTINIRIPLEAPGIRLGSRETNKSGVDWTNIKLHPALVNKLHENWISQRQQERAAINRLIRDWLVPRYDLVTPLHLAAMLKRERKTPFAQAHARARSPKPLWSFFGPLLAFGVAILLNYIIAPSQSQRILVPWIALAGMVIIYVKSFDLGLLAHLALPRILGGIGAGYFVLIIEDNDIAQAIWGDDLLPQWSNSGPFWLLAGVAIVASAVYFYIDAQRIVINQWEAARRAAMVLAMVVILALGVGLAAVALSTAAYEPETKCFLMGPFGKVNLAQYLAFAPLAMLAGLILQFIWQDRSASSAVGTPEAF